jgi:hypothetical protein
MKGNRPVKVRRQPAGAEEFTAAAQEKRSAFLIVYYRKF